jgi:hypothetical protein
MNNPLEIVVNTLKSWKEIELSYQVLDAFGKRSSTFEESNLIAKYFFEFKNLEKAIEYGKLSLSRSSSNREKYTTKANLINAYNQSNQPEKALSYIKDCKKVNPNDTEILLEETFSYSALNKKEKSDILLFDLIERNDLTNNVKKKAYHNLSGYYFKRDDILKGLEHFLKAGEYEAYKNQKELDYEKWDGTITKGRTIIIDNQCGAGDEVMHIRFMNNLKNLGMNPIWLSTRRELVELFTYNGYESVCVYDNPTFPKDSCWVYALALPYHLNITPNDLEKNPYLTTMPEYDKKWDWIKEDKKYKVGLFWKSSSGFEQNNFRSVELDDLMSILVDKDYSLYSLQTYNDNSDAEKYNISDELCVPSREYSDTFSIINELDLVITSCSFTAHVAASLGKKVCIFVPIMEYYVWTSSTGKTFWYGDNVHLFRQVTPRCWKEPIKKLEEFLR